MRMTLNGIVASDEDCGIYQYFGYSAFSPRTVREALAQAPADEELVIEVNSGGGSVMAGAEIYTVLKGSGVRTVAEIQSLAASAASYLCLGCDEVRISPVAQMMIHLPSTCTEGDRTDHLRSVQMLDSTREAILNAYELKAGGKADRAALRRMMTAETWLTAQEAVDCGLADGILGEEAPASPADLMNAFGLPDIAKLRARYEEAHKNSTPAGKVPETDTQDWRAQARLDLEKIRF